MHSRQRLEVNGLRSLAITMASCCVANIELNHDCLDLRALMQTWGLTLRALPDEALNGHSSGLGIRAFVRETDCTQDVLPGMPDPQKYVATYSDEETDISLRFVLAHELAHVILKTPEFERVGADLSTSDQERLCDIAAEYILLPDEILFRAFPSRVIEFSIAGLERLRITAKARITLIVRRLASLVAAGKMIAINGCLIAMNGAARKSRQDYAPRVFTSCVPRCWYLPVNKRLKTVGLGHLEYALGNTPLFIEQRTSSELEMWNSEKRKAITMESELSFKCYLVGRKRHADLHRMLLATFNLPECVDNST